MTEVNYLRPLFSLTNLKTGSCAGASVVGLGYDERGNLANKNGQLYQFDIGNRLREAVDKEGYRYDGHGRRVRATAPGLGSIYSFYGQGGQLLYQDDQRQGRTTNYLYLGSSLVATLEKTGNTYAVKYQHTDALGTPVAVSDGTGAVVQTSEYTPYGQLFNRPLTDGPGIPGM